MKISSDYGKNVKKFERPPCCPNCRSPTWWNGTRIVSSVCLVGSLVKHLSEVVRRRARCPNKKCTMGSFSIYESDSYPHRLYRLMLVVKAVAAATIGRLSYSAVARLYQCSRDSIRRWCRWVAKLADPSQLMQACARLDAFTFPGAVLTGISRAGVVVYMFDRLATLLTERGLKLPNFESGLVSNLIDQLVRFRHVLHLTKSSPPLLIALGGICM